MRVVVRLAGLLLVAPGILLAQAGWIPPQPPCELPPANSKINNAIAALRGAADKPESRDQQLAQAKRLLSDAIVQDNQGANPAAWYYLGRLAVTTSDVAGADTALARAAALAPTCADDIARYRHDLWGDLLNNGLAAWQDGRQDSGLVLLRLAVRLEPANPKPLAAAAGLLASRGNDDSAFAYYRLAAKTAGADTGFATDKRDAPSEYVRAYPGEPEAATSLATLYAQSGRWAPAAAVFDSLAAHAPELEADALFAPGSRMVEQGMYRAGARALTLGLAKNPYRRDALFSLAVAYYQLRDSASLLPVAQRL